MNARLFIRQTNRPVPSIVRGVRILVSQNEFNLAQRDVRGVDKHHGEYVSRE